MRIGITEAALLGDPQRYLRAADRVAEQADEDALDVYIPRAPSDEQARREVVIYLKTWRAMNRAARADVVA